MFTVLVACLGVLGHQNKTWPFPGVVMVVHGAGCPIPTVGTDWNLNPGFTIHFLAVLGWVLPLLPHLSYLSKRLIGQLSFLVSWNVQSPWR